MKICMILSGIPRHIEQGYKSIFPSLIEPNDPDIFIHTWANPATNTNIENQLRSLYNPKCIVMEPQKIFINSSLDMDRMMKQAPIYKRDPFVATTYSMWYSIQQANLLKEYYRLENNINYDYVIRARFDLTYNIKINCKEYDKNLIHISNRELPPEMIDDRFAFGPNHLMNVYCGGFNMLDYIHSIRVKSDGIFCGETLVYETFKAYNIPYERIVNLQCAHLNH